ncbi:MAG: hypothetical protein U5L96_04235 [Owenweeksia sp.]|nr:hypothetical protein [Owenweeksia sp.]
MPLTLKWKSERVNNYRLYVLGGAKCNHDLSSKADVDDDRIFKLQQNDLFYEFGFGIDIYFEFFKFSPQIVGSWGFADINVQDGTFYVEGINRLESRSIMMSFTFDRKTRYPHHQESWALITPNLLLFLKRHEWLLQSSISRQLVAPPGYTHIWAIFMRRHAETVSRRRRGVVVVAAIEAGFSDIEIKEEDKLFEIEEFLIKRNYRFGATTGL